MEQPKRKPLYAQVKQYLYNLILNNYDRESYILPSENALCQNFTISRITAKRALDDKIVKLNAFLEDEEKASKITGWFQVGQMREQLDVMLRYSGILNTRILTWRHN